MHRYELLQMRDTQALKKKKKKGKGVHSHKCVIHRPLRTTVTHEMSNGSLASGPSTPGIGMLTCADVC